MEKSVLVLCDTEEEYAQLMSDFLKGNHNMPWEIHTYTNIDTLLLEERDQNIRMLVVAETAYSKELEQLNAEKCVILNESGVIKWDKLSNINKYQQADNVQRELLEIYTELTQEPLPFLKGRGTTKFVGMYSPVKRCLQTSFALTMAQLLAQEHRTLYLNLEHYAGITELVPDVQTRDMADLLYFLTAKQDKFCLRMKTMIQKQGCLDYIPPMKAGSNLLLITSGEWQQLLHKIEELNEYEYVILDLSDSVQGLFDILRMCCKVFTLTKADHLSQCKLMQYEQVLQLYEYEDVLGKTNKCEIPKINRLPEDIEQLTKSELAKYAAFQIKELCG